MAINFQALKYVSVADGFFMKESKYLTTTFEVYTENLFIGKFSKHHNRLLKLHVY